MYGKCDEIASANAIFDGIEESDRNAYFNCCEYENTLNLFDKINEFAHGNLKERGI